MRQTQLSNSTGVTVHLVGSDKPMDRALRAAVREHTFAHGVTRRASRTTTKGQSTMAVQKPKNATGKTKATPTKTKTDKPKREKVVIQKAKEFKTYAEYCDYRAGLFQEKVDAWKQKSEDFKTGKLGKNKKLKRFQKMQSVIAKLEAELREAGLDPDKLEAASE